MNRNKNRNIQWDKVGIFLLTCLGIAVIVLLSFHLVKQIKETVRTLHENNERDTIVYIFDFAVEESIN